MITADELFLPAIFITFAFYFLIQLNNAVRNGKQGLIIFYTLISFVEVWASLTHIFPLLQKVCH